MRVAFIVSIWVLNSMKMDALSTFLYESCVLFFPRCAHSVLGRVLSTPIFNYYFLFSTQDSPHRNVVALRMAPRHHLLLALALALALAGAPGHAEREM